MYFSICQILVLCVLIGKVCCWNNVQGCKLDVANTEKGTPLLFYNYTTHFELAIPQRGEINLNAGDRITLACTGTRNYLTATNSNSTYATCISETTLRIIRRHINFHDLECKKDIRGDVRKNSTKKCANGEGYITEIGYQITKNDWFTLIKICYNGSTGSVLYTQHYLHGSEIKYAAKISDRPGFSTEGLGPKIPASVAYNKTFQKSTFNSLLSSAKLASDYINNNSYLARGHLAPAADFILATSKRTTYYYINTIPQWQIINGGNWKSIEIRIRKTAEAYNRTFNISTGTYGVLTLPDINRDLKPIYLVSRNKLPVPRDIWKIVYDPETQMGIANIVMNNPFLERVSEEDLLCDNICEQNGWGTINWSNFSRGFTYCCDLIQFQKAVGIVHHPTVRGILRGTNSP